MAGSKDHRTPPERRHADPPRPLPPSLSGNVVGAAMTFWPIAEDVPDDAVLEVAEITPPRHGQLIRNPDGTLTYVPDPAFTGIDRFGYTLSDGAGNLYPASVTVAVEHDDVPPKPEPRAAPGPEAAPTRSASRRTPGIADFSHGANGTVALDDEGALVYTPKPGFSGRDSFTYTVAEADGSERTASVIVEIEPSGAYRVVRQSDVG